MKMRWWNVVMALSCVLFGLSLCSCGGSLTRYSPAAPAKPAGLVATAGSKQVALSWTAADNAASYNVYYSTSPGVTKSNGTKFATPSSTSSVVTGLENGTTYYFVVTAVNSAGESDESNQVSAAPVASSAFSQADLTGVWNFNALVAGSNARWMRGKLSIDATGTVSFSDFRDSSGNTTPPAGFLSVLYLDATGQVRDSASGAASFRGSISSRLNMVAGVSGAGADTMIAILQRQESGVSFSDADLQGFGNAGGGARRFVYHQVSSGSTQEWEYAVGQIGSDQTIQYATFLAPSNPVTPGKKASRMSMSSSDGIVAESRQTGVSPQPALVIDRGVMSADKSVLIATATDTSGANPRHVLRIYQFININTNDTNTLALADLSGVYRTARLTVGSALLTASGLLRFDATGAALYSSWLDSTNSSALPSGFSVTMDTVDTKTGILTNGADSSFHGKLSYFKDMLVATMNDSAGNSSLLIGLK